MCLEFSKIDNEFLNFLYKNYSKAIPALGKYIVGSSKPYEYLISSIDTFYNQEQLLDLITKNGFKITGHLINNVVNDCDRCLCSYIVKDKLKVHFNVYNNPSSIDNRKDDILYWPSKKDSIDISDYLIEILLVEVPFKKLCSTDCKGICIKCGSNRNDESCLCEKNK